jgi:hypothetical protein
MQVIFVPDTVKNDVLKVLYAVFVGVSLVSGLVSFGFHLHHIRAFRHALNSLAATHNVDADNVEEAEGNDENDLFIKNLEWEEKKNQERHPYGRCKPPHHRIRRTAHGTSAAHARLCRATSEDLLFTLVVDVQIVLTAYLIMKEDVHDKLVRRSRSMQCLKATKACGRDSEERGILSPCCALIPHSFGALLR